MPRVAEATTKPSQEVAVSHPIRIALALSIALVQTLAIGGALVGCSSGPEIKQDKYAKLSDRRTFEYGMPAVWGGIENVFKGHAIKERDPDDVSEKELETLKERELETDWSYTQSRDKYYEYKVNGSPRRKNLQMRIRYEVTAKAVLGGVDVAVKTTEELEKLKPDGTPDGYSKVSNVDSSRPAEILEKINLAILAAQPDR
jgi:hypothetical protein